MHSLDDNFIEFVKDFRELIFCHGMNGFTEKEKLNCLNG